MNALTDQERILRLEWTLGTLLTWLQGCPALKVSDLQQLIKMLNDDNVQSIPAFLRKKP